MSNRYSADTVAILLASPGSSFLTIVYPSFPLALYGLFLCLLVLDSCGFLLCSRDKQGKLRTVEHTLGNAAYHPALETAATMCCHGDQVASLDLWRSHVFTMHAAGAQHLNADLQAQNLPHAAEAAVQGYCTLLSAQHSPMPGV